MSDWDRLVSQLDGWAISAAEVGPGRIRVMFRDQRGKSKTADIVMTRDQWGEMAGTMWGDLDKAIDQVRQSLLRLGRERYLIYGQYELEPSPVPVPSETDPG